MTTTAPRTDRAPAARRRPSRGVRALQIGGWTLIVVGVVVLLYVVYALFFTNLETGSAQRALLEEWERDVGAPAAEDEPAAADPAPAQPVEPAPEPPAEAGGTASSDDADDDPVIGAEPRSGEGGSATGGAVARLEFVRPGSADPPVRADPLLVVDDVTRDALRRGPGHYPSSGLPGEDGNFAVAGHRTTYGAPFFHLDELTAGDEIHVTDRTGRTHVYAFVEQRIVNPGDTWVIGPDALDRGAPLLTLTTCHPRFSDRYRLVVFAELVP
jgi:sortase A